MNLVIQKPSNELFKLVKLNVSMVLILSNKIASLSEGYEKLR